MHGKQAVTLTNEGFVHSIWRKILAGVLELALGLLCSVQLPAQMLTLTHFPNPADFPTLTMLGYDAAVITLNPNQPASWKPVVDAAAASGIKLIAGGYPAPYQLINGSWTITSSGMAMLSFLQSRSDVVMALYVFNEPYYTNPYTSQPSPCGFFSAADLRTLRTTIQGVWPGVKIYHDLGNPSEWAPTGAYASRMPCVANKYADQTGVADYVGIWEYPYTPARADTAGALNALTAIATFVVNSMKPALPISLNQVFACPTCAPSLVFPTRQQVLSWNCATRALPLAGVDWYSWRAFIPTYSEGLGDHRAYWPLTTAGACAPGTGSDLIGVSGATGMPFVAPASIVSVFGANLASAAAVAETPPLPLSVGGMTLQVRDAQGTLLNAPLAYVSAGQINFVMPAAIVPGQARLSWLGAAGPAVLGTVLVRNTAPALFSADGSGSGPPAGDAVLVGSDNQQSLAPLFQCTATTCTTVPVALSGTNSAYLTLYATGLRNYTTAVTCAINGVSVPVASVGPQGYYDGLDQLNIGPLPDLSGLGEVSLFITVDGVPSNSLRVNFQ